MKNLRKKLNYLRKKLTKSRAIECAFIENVLRESLTAIEEGRMFETIIENLPKNVILHFTEKLNFEFDKKTF